MDRTGEKGNGVEGAPHCYVVGVGASAGGLEALERLFEGMPQRTGVAFVVVQHLSPDFKSLTDELLARRTSIPIHRVENGMAVQPDAIYLIPPKKDMILSSGRLLLTDKDPSQFFALPIDHFFRSLAQELGERAVAVVLSGTGSDGSRGLREIHAAGGLVIAQSPDSAKFDGMPRSALETGAVHLTLAPEEIPDAILRHIKHPEALPAPEPAPDQDLPAGMAGIFRLLRESHGIDFAYYKPDTVTRRVERRLLLSQSISLEQYERRLASDPAELNLLYKDLLIGVTRFMRDEEAFERLRCDILPDLLARVPHDEEFRVWVAGCATGEEPYSLAIAIRECIDSIGRDLAVKIFATDVHRGSLEAAGAGLFPNASLAGVSEERIGRFFVRRGDSYQVTAELRKMVVFAPHNLIKDAPFTKLDLITCRNLLIYFQPAVQKKVLSLFHFGLRAGGILFLGPSESPGELSDEFDALDPRWKLYRKRRDVRLAPDIRLPAAFPRPRGVGVAGVRAPSGIEALPGVYDALLQEFVPTGILVNEHRELVQVFGGASRFLSLRDGRFSGDILDVVDAPTRTALAGALPRVLKEQSPMVYKGLRVEASGVEVWVNLTIKPITNLRGGQMFAMILFEELKPGTSSESGPRELDFEQAGKEHLLAVESELRYTKENLQAMIEELETSNEELQATNEELVASNEELQSTNEELHSVNEELYTVNAEYQHKIAELTDLSADMDHLLVSTEVHTIFLDDELCIRKFTPKIAETFNLLPQDVGRRIDHFTYSIEYPALPERIRGVLAGGEPFERPVRDRHGKWYLLRILPYRKATAPEGVVLTLIDITAIKEAEAQAAQKDEQLRGILANSPSWVFVRDFEGRYLLTDASFPKAIGGNPIGKTPHDLFPREVAEILLGLDAQVIEEGRDSQTEVEIPLSDGPHTFLAVKFPLRDEEGKIVAIGGIKTDVTQLKRAEEHAREAVRQRDRFLAMLSHELRNPLLAILNAARVLQRARDGSVDLASWLSVIERRSRHMSRLLDDLLDVARIAHDKIEIHKTVFDLASTMSEVCEEVEPWFRDSGLRLLRQPADEPLPVEGDSDRLQQIQVNLLMNAAKFTPAGGQVWYRMGREGATAVIRVRDTGIGMTAEMRDRVFDLFVQADDSLSRPSGGIGVGLTIVRAIVDRHGGQVSAHSDGSGKGSEFVVRLPLCHAAPGKPVAPEPPTLASARSALRLLVVEDDPDIRESLRCILDLEGFPVRAAPDGPDALEKARALRPDVMLIDIGLPGMTGYDVARAVRSEWDGDGPVLIALTGYGQPRDRDLALSAGFDQHLTKPIQPVELVRFLESLAARRADPGKRETQ